MKVDAIVLAGGQNDRELKDFSQVANEALIPIGNTVMVDYVVSALKKCSSVDKIVVVGPVEELEKYYKRDSSVKLVPPGKNAIESVLNGLKHISMDKMLLISTGDIPLLTPEAVEDFLHSCSKRDADLFYSIVSKENSEKKYPGVERTYVKLKDGTYTGGNIILANPRTVEKYAYKGQKFVELRKKPLALSRLMGFRFILKFLLKSLSLSETEERFSELLGFKGVGIISQYPEVGIDVDKPSDLKFVKKALESKAS